MKHVYIIDECMSSNYNGIGTYLKELVKCFKELDMSINIVAFNSEFKEFTINYNDKVCYYYFPKLLQGNFFTYPNIVNYFFKLYINDSADNIFCINHFPSIKLIKQIRKSYPLSKIVFIVHDLSWTEILLGDYEKLFEIVRNERKKEIQDRYEILLRAIKEEKLTYETVDKVICLSESTYQILSKIYLIEKHKIFCMPNGLTDCRTIINKNQRKKLRKKYFIFEDEKIILFVGRLNKAKGLSVLLKAFKDVLTKQRHARLVIAGHVLYPAIPDATTASRITYLGQVSASVLKDWYQLADMGVIASYTEQCSYVGIEMMMHQLPIVASDGFGLKDMFCDRRNAKIASIEKYDEGEAYQNNLTRAILEVLLSDGFAEKLTNEARIVYEKKYSIVNMREKYKELIANL